MVSTMLATAESNLDLEATNAVLETYEPEEVVSWAARQFDQGLVMSREPYQQRKPHGKSVPEPPLRVTSGRSPRGRFAPNEDGACGPGS